MSTRRRFITQSSLGLVGAFAVRDALRSESLGAQSTNGPVLRWVPKHEELAYTFGGVAPRQLERLTIPRDQLATELLKTNCWRRSGHVPRARFH